MTNSGFKVNEECRTLFEEFKMAGTESLKYDYIILVPDMKEGVVTVDCYPAYGKAAEMEEYKDATNEPPSYKRLREYLQTKPTAYCFYDFRWVQADGASDQSKCQIKLISWSDDNKATGREKMVFAGTKETLKKALRIGHKDHSAHYAEDLDYKDILSDLSRGKNIVNQFSRN